MKVLKFGGTSVANAENIKKVFEVVQSSYNETNQAVVVSAFGGITDHLLKVSALASQGNDSYKNEFENICNRHLDTVRELISAENQSQVIAGTKIRLNELEDVLQGVYLVREISPKTRDFILSFGERLSAFIIAQAFNFEGLQVAYADSRELIKTSADFGKAEVLSELTDANITNYFATSPKVVLLPGFVGSTESGDTTTLGRGGSDFTAAIVASALQADSLEIWTDVSGVMTADPRKVKSALPISHLTYNEAMELSHFGAKVIYPPTIQPVLDKNIPLLVKNTFEPNSFGSLINNSGDESTSLPIRGLSSIDNVVLMSLQGSGLIGVPGISSRLFGALYQAKVNVILITQASSEHSISFAILPEDMELAKTEIEREFELEMARHQVAPIVIEKDLSVIAVVGENMRHQPGISGRVFSTLGSNGVNIIAIAQGSSERNISFVISNKDEKKALNTLHETFFLSNLKHLHLFVAGTGNVGATFINQVKQQAEKLSEEHHIVIRVVGMSNSRKMLFNTEGIDLETYQEELKNAEDKPNMKAFVDRMKELNLRNSIFIDNTAHAEVAEWYQTLLESSIHVVTPNKIASSSSYEHYKTLKRTARKFGVKYLFETNVGAGLPIISTLNDLVKSGDKVMKMEAVLSGTLNFVFNSFVEGTKFSDIVKQAHEQGFTEPDPRIDLGGTDVMRKILILARESGLEIEFEDITCNGFMPEECMKAKDMDEFYQLLPNSDDHFEQLRKEAESKGQKLCFVASYEDGKASVGLRSVGPEHPAYPLQGSDNIVLFTTERYNSQPLIVQGAGAGAEVTAAGVFADVIRIANN